MTQQQVPRVDLEASMKRVMLFADAVGAEAPSKLIDEDGGPAEELLRFVDKHDASLDWIFCNDVRSLIYGLRRRPSAAA